MSFYYLHSKTKDLIWKKFEPEDESNFVQKVWPCNPSYRKDAWAIILEGLALGASIKRVGELCKKWDCNLTDFEEMLINVKPTESMREGATIFLEKIMKLDVDEYWNKLKQR